MRIPGMRKMRMPRVSLSSFSPKNALRSNAGFYGYNGANAKYRPRNNVTHIVDNDILNFNNFSEEMEDFYYAVRDGRGGKRNYIKEYSVEVLLDMMIVKSLTTTTPRQNKRYNEIVKYNDKLFKQKEKDKTNEDYEDYENEPITTGAIILLVIGFILILLLIAAGMAS